ncbi:MAG: TIGR03087 family PEP-CTERM/XrtA system glycosyltransferase [Candidatus Promineifilaceae bacterium]|nr:TIGR03087 family PEP-CTERM/XrtA system glycosyltransferase [Candidatus Promineifilaceae bacterium]
MRILCLTSRLPYPPHRGDRLRAFNFIRQLSPSHELHLVSFIARQEEREHVALLRDYFRQIRLVHQSPLRSALAAAGNAWRRDPLQVGYYRSRAMQRLVNDMLATHHFDAAYVHLFRMTPYLARATDLYRIVDLTDVISEEVKRSLAYRNPLWRLVYRLEGPRISAYERRVARTFEETWLISEADRRILAAACPDANIQVVPNGVDLQRFHPTGTTPRPHSLLFVGHLQVFHNVDAATYLVEEVLPLVRREVPEARLRLVGADPGPAVQRLAAAPGVEVAGFVPELNAELNEAAVFVAPLRFAAGVQNKVLEAMAAGRPVVTSSLVSAGLGAQPDRHLLVADDPVAAARHVARLLRDKDERARLGAAGRRFVAKKYRWDYVTERIATIEEKM